MSTAKPFLKWVGGKTQLLQDLVDRLPSDFDLSVNTYIEPFVGGGAFLFWILQNKPNISHVIINDSNSDLINAYLTIQKCCDDLLDELLNLEKIYYAFNDEIQRKAFFLSQREVFNKTLVKPLSVQIKKTALLIFLNRTCFNGLYRVNSKGQFNVPFGRYTNPCICNSETIKADSLLLQNVEIRNSDFEQIIDDVTSSCFLYLDPPYRPLNATSSFCNYTKGGFDDSEQTRLSLFCRNLDKKKARWMLSNSDPKGKNPTDTFFDVLYKGFNIQSVQASRMLNSNPQKRGKLGELLITNY